MTDTQCIIDVGAIIGGDESHHLVEILVDMYARWAERQGVTCDVLDRTPAPGGGLKSGKISLVGVDREEFAALHAGVHVMVRTPPDDLNQRRHMCAAGVRVSGAADLELPDDMKAWGDEVRRYVFDPEPAIVDARLGRFRMDPGVMIAGDFSLLHRT